MIRPSIQDLCQQLRETHGAVAVFGCELEWYLTAPADPQVIEAIWQEAGREVKPEKGSNQYETVFEATADIPALIAEVDNFKVKLTEVAERHDAEVSFAAKPMAGERGSALQIHIHLEDAVSGERLFVKRENELSQPLRDALGGLLACLPESLPVFAPNQDSAKRFIEPKQDAPTTISWGANNRTVALRIPMKTGALCHIEHRVPGADADVAASIAEVLRGVIYGLEHHPDPGPQIFGDASDEQYGLVKLISG